MYKFKILKEGLGEIQIDDFKETFEIDHRYWSIEEYEDQWRVAAQRLKHGLPAMFITSICEPSYSNFFRVWNCYPIGNELAFQEQVLFLDQLDKPLDINNPHIHIEPYESITEDGDQISEWRTSASS